MSTSRVVLPRPTSPASTLGAGGNVPNTLEPQRARAPQNITAQSPVTPVSNPVAAGPAAQRGPAASPNDAWVRAQEQRVLRNMLEAKRKGTATHNGGK